MTDALTIRNEKKAKKPTFKRSDSHKKVRIGDKWRRPKGIQSKVRLQKKGYVRSTKIGWGSPRTVKGLSRGGIQMMVIENVEQLACVKDTSTQGIIIASNVGARKKIDILKSALEKSIIILNEKDPQGFIKAVEDRLSKKKKAKEKKETEKKKKAKEKEETAKKKEEEDKKETQKDELEQKVEKEETKKEQEKILTKKDSI